MPWSAVSARMMSRRASGCRMKASKSGLMSAGNGPNDRVRSGYRVATGKVAGIGCAGLIVIAHLKTIPPVDLNPGFFIDKTHIRHLTNSGNNGIEF